ncbi:hypothetical protein [Fibrobacter sp.]|uniref:hypothetical protein n=1 Tax=Fibrobacter sp. TaxID=35828 RepID=UPI0025BFB001|nr:hypothetical protein [Fibrobacter sp.]MBR3072149.1 hypothetical protein [Fibrobacter sp.]
MHLTFKVSSTADMLPPDRELAQAAGRGVSNAVKRHLVERDRRSVPAPGMPRTGYYGDAANSVTTEMNGSVSIVTIHKEGVALHYYGGVVYPTSGHKALAIPQVPAAAGRRPAEIDPSRQQFALVWPKGSTAGTLRDKETNDVWYLLVAKAAIPADQTVLPTESAMTDAANAAIGRALEHMT